jgi:hypothetical protein
MFIGFWIFLDTGLNISYAYWFSGFNYIWNYLTDSWEYVTVLLKFQLETWSGNGGILAVKSIIKELTQEINNSNNWFCFIFLVLWLTDILLCNSIILKFVPPWFYVWNMNFSDHDILPSVAGNKLHIYMLFPRAGVACSHNLKWMAS